MDPVERGLNSDGVYAGDYHSIYHLCTNIDGRLPEGLMEFTAFAIFLVKVLQNMKFFPDETGITPSSREGMLLIILA